MDSNKKINNNIEDSENLSFLESLVANGTNKAYKNAVKIYNEVIFSENGKIIKKVKGEKAKVLNTLEQRKVKKGAKISLNSQL